MLFLFCSFLALTSLSLQQNTSGCGVDHSASVGLSKNYTLGDREYLLHLPKNYKSNTATGVIFSYHGKGKDMRQQEQLSQFSDETWNPNMISVYPQGIDNAWEGAPYAPPSEHPDKAFTTNLLNHIKSTYCIDTSRVFASGMSNGGGFVDTLACSNAHGRDFAAFAPVSGAFYDDLPDNNTCSPYMSVTPLLEFHGNNTAHIPYSGGPSDTGSSNIVPSIPGLLNRWAIRDGCTDPPTFQTSRQNDSDVEIRTYTCSGAQGNVIGYLIESMAHSWPSIKAGTAPIDATPIIIDFFNSHPKPA